jgi:hypothetical protein
MFSPGAADIKTRTTHVEALVWIAPDAGSIPAVSIPIGPLLSRGAAHFVSKDTSCALTRRRTFDSLRKRGGHVRRVESAGRWNVDPSRWGSNRAEGQLAVPGSRCKRSLVDRQERPCPLLERLVRSAQLGRQAHPDGAQVPSRPERRSAHRRLSKVRRQDTKRTTLGSTHAGTASRAYPHHGSARKAQHQGWSGRKGLWHHRDHILPHHDERPIHGLR